MGAVCGPHTVLEKNQNLRREGNTPNVNKNLNSLRKYLSVMNTPVLSSSRQVL
jgi:hypothetical protein